jgi:ankyrin repeat protein
MAAAYFGHRDAIQLLLAHGAKVGGSYGRRALTEAASVLATNTIEVLLNAGADVNAHHGETSPLQAAAYAFSAEPSRCGSAMTLLIDRGADVNYRSKPDGWTALHCAIVGNGQAGTLERVKLLVERGAVVDCSDREGNTPLILACEVSKSDVGEYLVERGASVNLRRKDGLTALMMAVLHEGSIRMIKALLANGADVTSVTHRGETALTMAMRSGRQEVVELLKASSPPP